MKAVLLLAILLGVAAAAPQLKMRRGVGDGEESSQSSEEKDKSDSYSDLPPLSEKAFRTDMWYLLESADRAYDKVKEFMLVAGPTFETLAADSDVDNAAYIKELKKINETFDQKTGEVGQAFENLSEHIMQLGIRLYLVPEGFKEVNYCGGFANLDEPFDPQNPGKYAKEVGKTILTDLKCFKGVAAEKLSSEKWESITEKEAIKVVFQALQHLHVLRVQGRLLGQALDTALGKTGDTQTDEDRRQILALLKRLLEDQQLSRRRRQAPHQAPSSPPAQQEEEEEEEEDDDDDDDDGKLPALTRKEFADEFKGILHILAERMQKLDELIKKAEENFEDITLEDLRDEIDELKRHLEGAKNGIDHLAGRLAHLAQRLFMSVNSEFVEEDSCRGYVDIKSLSTSKPQEYLKKLGDAISEDIGCFGISLDELRVVEEELNNTGVAMSEEAAMRMLMTSTKILHIMSLNGIRFYHAVKSALGAFYDVLPPPLTTAPPVQVAERELLKLLESVSE